jgi:molecular chaperone DnaK
VPIIGIDLGTMNSVIAHLDGDGKPVTIHNAEGDLTTPSVVLFDTGGIVVGKEALKAAALEPEIVAAFAKREMGEQQYSKPIRGHHLPPEVVQSFVLRKLREDASAVLGEVSQAVITVPAFFNEPRRKATQDAGLLAGLEVVDIINEPTAAAIAFGVHRGFLTPQGTSLQPECVLVYDLGGGTFDVTVMRIEGAKFEAIATAGDVYLGGIDWDQALAELLAQQFVAQFDADPREDAVAWQRLLQEAEDAKRSLSQRVEVTVPFEFAGKRGRFKVSRAEFEGATAGLLDRTRFTTTQVLQEAGLAWGDLTRILLVGGSTRMPMVHAMLEQASGLKPDRSISPDEAVAHGAAIYAGMLSSRAAGQRPLLSVVNVNSHNLGVLGIEPATGRPRNRVLIPRNTPLPTTQRKRFKTYQDNQPNVAVRVIEGGDASGQNGTHIGKCVVSDLPPNLPKGTPVEVSFSYSPNGRLLVEAFLPTVERGATLEVQRTSGLTDEDLRRWQGLLADTAWLLEDAPAAEAPAAAEIPAVAAVETVAPQPAAAPAETPEDDEYEDEYDDAYEEDEYDDEYEYEEGDEDGEYEYEYEDDEEYEYEEVDEYEDDEYDEEYEDEEYEKAGQEPVAEAGPAPQGGAAGGSQAVSNTGSGKVAPDAAKETPKAGQKDASPAAKKPAAGPAFPFEAPAPKPVSTDDDALNDFLKGLG